MEILVPDDFTDLSKLRQVPENQELYCSSNSSFNIIIEIIQPLETSDILSEAHFKEMAEFNSTGFIILKTFLVIVNGLSCPVTFGTFDDDKTRKMNAVCCVSLEKVDAVVLLWTNSVDDDQEDLVLEIFKSFKWVDFSLFI